MPASELLISLLAGCLAGLPSGLLGVSPGGILVPILALLLPFPQHLLQGISLLVQVPPTGLSALSIYSKGGRRVTLRAVALVSTGFVIGGPLGAISARLCTDRELRWMFVGYLLLLALLAIMKKSKAVPSIEQIDEPSQRSSLLLVGIGMIAGFTSGLLGIGGGLAITALAVVFLHQKQHQAQALSLAITTLPLTLPAAWFYIRQGWHLPWTIIACLVAGLIVGTRIGGLFANRLSERNLKIAFTTLLLGLSAYMAATAGR